MPPLKPNGQQKIWLRENETLSAPANSRHVVHLEFVGGVFLNSVVRPRTMKIDDKKFLITEKGESKNRHFIQSHVINPHATGRRWRRR
jgi:hypothetical protein